MSPASPVEVETLVAQWYDWATKVSRYYARKYGRQHEIEDVVGDGLLALVQAAQRYDPAVGTPFRSYAKVRLQGAVIDGIRGRCPGVRQRNQPDVCSYDDDEEFVPLGVEDTGYAQVEANILATDIIARLRGNERTVVNLALAGNSGEEIAERMHVSASRISQIRRKAREHARTVTMPD